MSTSGDVTISPRTLFVMGLAGVLLLALSARTGVAALSPLAGDIELDVPLEGIFLGLLGMVPPIAYGVAAWLTRPLVARVSLENIAVLVGSIAVVGHVLRGVSPNYLTLFLVTALLMLAVGVTNVLLPALVKLYAPRHIGPVTSLYSMLMALSSSTPAVLGVWLADEFGWRWSLASWAVLSALAIVPWLLLLPHARARQSAERVALVDAPPTAARVSLWRSATARWLAILFAMSGFVAYSMFALLPVILVEIAGFGRDEAGFGLFLWSMMGVPLSMVIPLLSVSPIWPPRLAILGAVLGMVGFVGLLVAPGFFTYGWVVLTGLATVGFSLVLTLIGARTENHRTAAHLSGLVNTVGYFMAAAGPVVLGLLAQLTGLWWPGLILLAVAISISAFAYPALRRNTTVDEELRQVDTRISD